MKKVLALIGLTATILAIFTYQPVKPTEPQPIEAPEPVVATTITFEKKDEGTIVDMATKAVRWVEKEEKSSDTNHSQQNTAGSVSTVNVSHQSQPSTLPTSWNRFGRLVSGKLGINVALASGTNLQSIVDAGNTAAVYNYGNAITIGDHRSQDFQNLVYTAVGDTMEIHNDDGSVTVLKCIRTGTGRNDEHGEYYLVNGQREYFDSNDTVAMVTCLDETGKNVFICEWVPVDGSSITDSQSWQDAADATRHQWFKERQDAAQEDPRYADADKYETAEEANEYIQRRNKEIMQIIRNLRDRLAAEGCAEANNPDVADVYTQEQADAYYNKVVSAHAAERATAKAQAEAEAKAKAEAEAKAKAEAEKKAKAEAEAKKQAEEEARLKAEAEAKAKAEEEARIKAEEEARAKAEAERIAQEEAERLAQQQTTEPTPSETDVSDRGEAS